MSVSKFFRKSALYLLELSLLFVLLSLAYFTVFAAVTANPEKIKQIANDSGIYQKITPAIYDNQVNNQVSKQGQPDNPAEALPLANEEVRNAVIKVFNPQFVQTNLESVIDGTYQWLNGEAPEPAFNLDLAGAKNQLGIEMANYAAARAETLPVCTLAQAREAQNTNLLSMPCRPPGADIAALKAEFIDSVNQDQNFLKDASISPATLKDDSGKKVFDDYKQVPETFQLIKKLPYILGALALLISTVIVLLSDSRRDGAKRLAMFLGMAGVVVVLIPLGINTLIDRVFNSPSVDALSKDLVLPVIDEFMGVVSKIYYITGAIYLLLAGGAFAVYKKLQPAGAPKKGKSDGTPA